MTDWMGDANAWLDAREERAALEERTALAHALLEERTTKLERRVTHLTDALGHALRALRALPIR